MDIGQLPDLVAELIAIFDVLDRFDALVNITAPEVLG